MKRIVRTLNCPAVALTAVAAFLALAYASKQHTSYHHQDAGAFIDRQLAEYHPQTARAKIMDIWNITEAEVAQPVRIFEEK